jgi:cytochrome P450
MLVSCLHGLDPREYDRPLEVDFDRPAKPPATFGAGAHRCPGASLARMEMRIMVEEWLRRIPDFAVDPDEPIVQRSGGVNGILRLPLRWSVV